MTDEDQSPRAAWIKLAAASAFGGAMLLLPVPTGETLQIPLGLLTGWVQAQGAGVLPAIVVAVCVISAVATVLYSAFTRPRGEDHGLDMLLRPGLVWTGLRIAGAATAVMVLFQLGPDWVWSADIGGLVLNDLMAPAFITIGLACIVLPFLTEFGLMELVAGLVERFFRRVFTVPGRSAVDAVASWLGGSSVGVLVTVSQYRAGLYTGREAAVIATNFSIVSIAFAFVIVEAVGLENLFFQFYGVLTLSGIVCAMIMPRIPPLRGKADDLLAEHPLRASDLDQPSLGRSLNNALKRADAAPGPGGLSRMITVNVLDIWLGLIPAAMVIATLSIAVAETTPVFDWLGWPFYWVLEALQVESAREAAPAMVIGFADMFLPALIAADISSAQTRFIVAVVAVGQLIFMSEVGVLILKSALPLNLFDLVAIFVLRTLILLPLATLGAALLL
ncbi:MAG: YjiH family protein [Oceanicaulis sp.]